MTGARNDAPPPEAAVRRPSEGERDPRALRRAETRLRILSAMVLVPAVLVSTFLGEIPFLLVVLLAAALVLTEWLRMIGAGARASVHLAGHAGLCLVAIAAQTLSLAAAVAAVAFASLLCTLAARRVRVPVRARWVAVGALYVGLALAALVALRRGSDGFGAVLFVLLVAWASDTAAYFVGRRLGGPKLWPRVSPAKTWSGAIGGLLAGVFLGAGVAALLGVPLSPAAILAAALVALAAQAGDLLESAAKRRFSIKDAGTLIPGHGGVMDRVDGVMAAGLAGLGLGVLMSVETPAAGLLSFMGRG